MPNMSDACSPPCRQLLLDYLTILAAAGDCFRSEGKCPDCNSWNETEIAGCVGLLTNTTAEILVRSMFSSVRRPQTFLAKAQHMVKEKDRKNTQKTPAKNQINIDMMSVKYRHLVRFRKRKHKHTFCQNLCCRIFEETYPTSDFSFILGVTVCTFSFTPYT